MCLNHDSLDLIDIGKVLGNSTLFYLTKFQFLISRKSQFRLMGIAEIISNQLIIRSTFLFYGEAASEILAKDRKSTRLNSSHIQKSRMPSSA